MFAAPPALQQSAGEAVAAVSLPKMMQQLRRVLLLVVVLAVGVVQGRESQFKVYEKTTAVAKVREGRISPHRVPCRLHLMRERRDIPSMCWH